MAGFFDRMWGRGNKQRSAKEAKERLQFILFHDRIDLPPEQLNAMKAEILEVISKYVAVDQDKVDIALQQRQRDSLIVAEIPFSKPAGEAEEGLAEMTEMEGELEEADDTPLE